MTLRETEVRARLRAATRALHERVERACPFGYDATFDHASYLDHLVRRLSFQLAIEPELRQWDGQGAELGFPGRVDDAARLRDDLVRLGMSPGALAALPVCRHYPRLDSFGRAAGARYVLEGARLGGRTIVARVADQLELGTAGVAFLASAGVEDLGARFRLVIAAIACYVDHHDSRRLAEVVAGARATFAELARWLETRELDGG